MLRHTTTGIKGEMLQGKGRIETLAKKGIVTILTSNGIQFSAPADQFQAVVRK